ncbi:hypothetical protein SPRG_03048 [Saprolegnia parasitica CBS 223.65]|uniref:U2A'/phosphoprotein 32 family A C-terminal domain-containing protein n=1 Tax=Saprolegnia parasitica (strain CBS 223.65) TaxID=695850 RepID=A0A067CPE7_SAPPC|nr:hypothetical protein SPRG_03048 [Saprolegnia parasitica CBS 223.65]KDO32574.1 hypothetical protein SPRG_03048 [Saprolegnia parasitica CBS 223.65]|eukprot:XP_012197019.1 hypothetical protein SPRG_03048 [Saprolegnia parasitica CBS 223.65]
MEARISCVNQALLAIKDVSAEEPTGVEVLNLHGNCIRTMDGLQRFPNLRELSLSSNWIEAPSYSALRGLEHLTVLDLSANRLVTTMGIPTLPALKELSLAYNALTVLDGLLDPLKLPQLEILDLRDNQIAHIDDLRPLFYLQNLRSLRLQTFSKSQSNPVCSTTAYPISLLDKMSALDVLDDEDVEVLREMAALAMPRYNTLAQAVLRRADAASPAASSSRSVPDALETRIRRLEERNRSPVANSLPKPPVLTEIDAEINRAKQNLRELHHQSLRTRPPPISVFVETETRHGYRVQTKDVSDDVAPPPPASPTNQTDLTDDKIEGLQGDLAVMTNRVQTAEASVLQLAAANATLTANIANLLAGLQKSHVDAVEGFQSDIDHITQQLVTSQASLRASEAQVAHWMQEHSTLKSKNLALEMTLAEAKAALDAATKAHASNLQDKTHAHTMVVQQLRRELADTTASLEDVYAKYAAKEKEVLQLRNAILAKTSDLDSGTFRHREEWQRRETEWKRQEQMLLRHSAMAIKHLQQALQKAMADAKAWELKCSAATARVAELSASHSTLSSQLHSMDKRVMKMQEAFERQMTELQETIDHLEHQVDDERSQRLAAEDAATSALSKSASTSDTIEALEAQLRDANALVQVKNVMLDDQSRLLLDARRDKDALVVALDDMRGRVEELEAALDDSLAAQADMAEYQREVEARAGQVESEAARLQDMERIQEELATKEAALEYLEGELHHLRKTVAKQEARSSEKIAQLETSHAAHQAELRTQAETLKSEIMSLQAKLQTAAHQLQAAKHQHHNMQKRLYEYQTRLQSTEHEMKVVLLQMEKERDAKRQHMDEIARLVQKIHDGAP